MTVKILSLMLSFTVLCSINQKKKIINKDKIKDVLGKDFYNDLLEIKSDIKLDRTIFGYFDRCLQVNEVLSKHYFFLKFFE